MLLHLSLQKNIYSTFFLLQLLFLPYLKVVTFGKLEISFLSFLCELQDESDSTFLPPADKESECNLCTMYVELSTDENVVEESDGNRGT